MFRIVPAAPTYHDPSTKTSLRHHPDVTMSDDEDEGLDLEEGSSNFTTPGSTITSSSLFMRGHGTYVSGDKVVSSVTGKVERVNKLVSVRPLRARFIPEVGDLVVGRITEVAAKRWKVDTGSRQDAVLMLSSVNLPGGVQRRKLESDELQMRLFFEEGDLLVAEVQTLMGDGTMSLHTRSLRYGKLKNGTLITLPPALVPRLKSHFQTLPCGVDLILGLNGYIWISMHAPIPEDDGEGGMSGSGFDAEGVYSSKNDIIPPATLQSISLVSNIVILLGRNNIPIHPLLVADAYDLVLEDDSVAGRSGVLSLEQEEGILASLRAAADN
ncbi:Exosomal 3'-5' exoribonuclease complex, subunit Rrp4 [Phaffia rhodozyma]|uniref:Exosomal 3'-5' exoribonuclease complex, subunit Rrp4 n=1 Tax=Phaffia rhodozyma TaxID=264483 RepID=A0A0F7SLT2_PHARH|nr:Exosomal 3'-5' exoribonuclease complex, subunit Rrp4 [Phaffia rhodozyma]